MYSVSQTGKTKDLGRTDRNGAVIVEKLGPVRD